MKLVWKIVAIAAVVLLVLGLALIVVSLLTGGSLESIRNNVAFTNYEESFADATPHTLQLSVGAGKLYVLPGDELRVEAKNIQEKGFVCRMEQGVLMVQEGWSASWSDNLSRWLNLRREEPEIYVYLPENFSVQFADIDVAAGSCRVEGLTASAARLDVSAGSLEVWGLTAGQTELEISAGSVYIDGLNTQTLDLDISAGSASVTGSVALDCTADVSAGSADLLLDGAADAFTAEIDAGAGSITYGGRRYSMQDAYVGQGPGVMELDCSAGSISVRFTD